MKKIVSTLLAFTVLLGSVNLTGCGLIRNRDYLVIYNWEEYIDEQLIEDFEKYYRKNVDRDFAGVRYETFDTNETFYTKATRGKEYWDVACPSDYMIGKMASKGMLAPIPTEEMPNFENLSPYMRDKFQEIVSAVRPDPGVTLSPDDVYGVGYMWGTMGIIYNTDAVQNNVPGNSRYNAETYSPIDRWGVMWDSYYDHRVYIKNSMREAFTIGALYAYSEDLMDKQAVLSEAEYTAYLTKKLNEVTPESLNAVADALKFQQKRVNVKYDVDFDKEAMANNSADLDFCWSGDGNLAIMMGAENDVKIDYCIPDEGTNIFFDGWVMNKDSRNKKAAAAFLDYLCDPGQAIANMEYIGYVSCVATSEIVEWAQDTWIGQLEGYIDEEGEFVDPTHTHMKDKASGYDDLALFFDPAELDKALAAMDIAPEELQVNPIQYPGSDIFHKLAVMQTYTDEHHDQVLAMWSGVKGGELHVGLITVIGVIFAAAAVLAVYTLLRKAAANRKEFKKHHHERSYPRL